MNDGTTYDVRVYRSEVYKGVKVTTYRVRWKAGNREWRQGFRTAAQRAAYVRPGPHRATHAGCTRRRQGPYVSAGQRNLTCNF
jgi:hypothetical protein